MSIKEALKRTQIDGEEIGASRQDRARAYWDKRRLIQSSYEGKVLEKGRSIHREAGVPGLLDELAEIIRPDFPDVRINEHSTGSGAVSLGIEWNFRDRSDKDTPFKYEYNAVRVEAYPLTEDVVVWGKEEGESLTKSQWSSDRRPIEEAIARAYKNPMIMLGPPVRI